MPQLSEYKWIKVDVTEQRFYLVKVNESASTNDIFNAFEEQVLSLGEDPQYTKTKHSEIELSTLPTWYDLVTFAHWYDLVTPED